MTPKEARYVREAMERYVETPGMRRRRIALLTLAFLVMAVTVAYVVWYVSSSPVF